jgi:hypothetical protein
MPLSTPPVALISPPKLTVPPVRLDTATTLKAVVLVMSASIVTLALPPMTATPTAAASLVSPI